MARTVKTLALLISLLLIMFGLTWSLPTAQAADTVAFQPRFTSNVNGAIVAIGNALLTCPEEAGGLTTPEWAEHCQSAKGGVHYDDNSFIMKPLDADGDAFPTSSSSMSELNLPLGAKVLWAGLYWGARLAPGEGGTAGVGDPGKMSLRPPGATAYQTIQASTVFGPNGASSGAYQGFADVTAAVAKAGRGQYWAGDIVTGTGKDRYAGWSLLVAYSAPSLPLRNLTVFDGFAMVAGGQPQKITLSGFTAPLDGPVDTSLSMVAYEGDLTQSGDYVNLNDSQLATAISPGSNFFNSTNDWMGQSVTSRTPADRNMLGFDVKNLTVSGAIGNGDSQAVLTFDSTGDTYYPGVLATAINLYSPDFTASSKTVHNLNGSDLVRPGDTLVYTVDYVNSGQDGAISVVSHDQLPAGVSYLPGSLELVSGPGVSAGRALTDSAGDDVGEVTGGQVIVRLGVGADASRGGALAIGDHSAFRFQVRVDDAAAGGLISNAADLDYQVATTGVTGHYTTNLAQTPVAAQADLEVTKSISPDHAVYGQPVTTTITVRNPVGPSTAQTVSVGDFLPPGFTITGPISITDPSGRAPGTCFQPAGAMSCQLTDLPVGATVIISYTGASSSDPGLSRPTLVNMATVASTTFDPNQDNNLALATVEQRSGADLQVTKTPTGFTARPGTTDAYTITVRNAGPSDANQVELIDLVPAASAEVLTVRSVNYQGDASADGVDCAPDRSLRWVCRIASLKASEQAIFQVVAQISADARPGDQFINQAQVTSATPEFDNSNNQAEAVGTVAQRQADIALTKSVDASPVVAGGGIVYTITAQNLGPSIATQVDLTDLLPAGVTVSAVSSSRGSCSTTGNRLDCSLASADDPMLVGTSATITISGQVHAAASSVANTVSYTASPDQPDPQPDNNQASVDPPVQAVADLAVTKTSTTRTLPAALGERIDFTISVVNHGPSLARQVELVDQLPLGLTLDQARFALPAGVNCSPLTPDQQLLCRLPDLAPGQQLELTVPTTASAEGLVGQVFELLQRVTVAGAVTDPDLSNNQASWRIDAQPQADLSVSKELLSGSPLTAGGLAHYRLTVANAGDNASRPQLTDQLPSGLAFQSVTSSHQSASECTPSGQVLTCLSDIPLQVGDQWAIDLMVKVDPGLTDQTQLTNHASVVDSLGVADPSLSNNQASLTSPVRSLTDLAVAAIDWRAFQGQDAPPGVSLTASPAGSTIWLTMDFLNQGPAAAMSAAMRVNSDLHLAVLTDDSGAPIVRWNGAVSAAGSNSCRLVEGELVCPLVNGSTDSAWSGSDVLGPGDRSSVAVLVYVYPDTAGSSGRGWVDATTSTPESDDLANNHRQAPLAISDGKSNLSVDKQIISESLIDGSLIAGRYFAYAIDVFQPAPADPTSGQGFADAADVVFTDPLPTGFHASSVYTTQGSCEQPAPGADQSIRCDLGTVPGPLPTVDGQRVTITVFGEIDEAAAPGVVTNVATATSSTGPQTVSGQRSTPLAAQADLELAMTVISPHRVGADGLPEVVAGQSLRYGLTVSNTGPSLAPGAVISVVLPAGLTLGVGSSRACGQSSPVGQSPVTVSCLLDRPLAVGASLTRSIVAVTPAAGDDQILTSHAQVALPGDASITDPVSENNQALASVRIARTVDLAVTATVSDLTPTPGDALTWVFTGHNLGPSIAGPSVMTVTLPDSFVADWTASRLDGSCSISSSGQGVDNRLTCRPLARLAPGDTLHQVIIGSFAIGTPPGDHTATGSISSASPESATDNNQASLTVNPVPKADLRLHKDLLTPAPIAAGVLVNYRLVAVSFGPSLADNVVVSDQLPIGMTIVTARFQAASNAGDCAAWPGDGGQSILRCEVGDLALMESVQVDLSVQLAASAEGQEFCNAALVGSGVIDPDAANNAARADCFRASGVIDPGPPTSPGQPAPAPGVTPSPTPPVPPTPGASRPAAPTGGLASAAGPGRVAVLAVLVAGGLLLGSALIRRRGRARDGWHQSGLH